jgi:hypothetical protein
MKRGKRIVGLIIGLILISMTVYDLLPYREKNYVTHTGSTSRSYDLDFVPTTDLISFQIEPFIEIHDPFPNTNNTDLLSSNINVSVLLISNSNSLFVSSSFYSYHKFENNTFTTFNDIRFNDNRHFYNFHMFGNTTDVSCYFSYTANYTIDMIYNLQPKESAWASFFTLLTIEGIILVGVIIFTSVLIYVGTRLMNDS